MFIDLKCRKQGKSPVRYRALGHFILMILMVVIGQIGQADARDTRSGPDQGQKYDMPALGSKVGPEADYYVLALSWSPTWCAEEKSRAREHQCRAERAYGFVVHGLWPQGDSGKQMVHCSSAGWVDQDIINEMLPIMPSKKLILHQWRKHGTCHGGEAADYFADTHRAWRSITIPREFHDLTRPKILSLKEVEAAFTRDNPGLSGDKVAVICNGRRGAEIRVCFDKDFRFRTCDKSVRDRCRGEITFPAAR